MLRWGWRFGLEGFSFAVFEFFADVDCGFKHGVLMKDFVEVSL